MTQEFKKLYTRDNKGNIVIWGIKVVNTGSQVDICVSYGRYDGARTLKWERDIQGKNIGKANETNSWEQALSQAESRINKQKRRGYITLEEAMELPPVKKESRITIFDDNRDITLIALENHLPKFRTDREGNIKPMKAQQYYRASNKPFVSPDGIIFKDRKYYYLTNPYVEKEAKAIVTKFPCMAQPKINGVRATIQLVNNEVFIRSKDGLRYRVAHIEDFLTINNDIFNYHGNELILDGELYIHNELLQDIASAVKKSNLNTPRVTFVLFDLAIDRVTNIERWKGIKEHIKPKLEAHLNCPIQLIRTVMIKNDSQAQLFTDDCIKQGYEGSIFRQLNDNYYFGSRKQNMTKLKRVLDEEFIINDVVPQEKDPTKGNFVCITPNNQMFEVNPQGTEDFKREVLYNRQDYIGKKLTCKFYEWTKDGKPFHIITNTVRDYE